MKWEAIDATYPILEPPTVNPSSGWQGKWPEQRAWVEALLTHFARRAVGCATNPIDQQTARTAVLYAYHNAFMAFGYGAGGSKADSEYWKSVCALLGAALADPQLVATCTGGKTLGARVQKSKVYVSARGHDLRGLARHLATAARAKLTASYVEAAMVPLRDDFAADKLRDPRVALVAAYVLLAQIAVLDQAEIPDACRAWLVGKPLDVPAGNVVSAVADGDDPRARIFEQFAAPLSNLEVLANHQETLVDAEQYPFDFRVFLPDRASDSATVLYLARQPLPTGWESRVDPHVARWLGGDVSDASIATRRKRQIAENKKYKDPKEVRAYVIRDMRLDPAVRALHIGDAGVLAAFTGGGKLTAFKGGKYFKDDWKKLLRYLGAAVKAKQVGRADVEPAWFDFLSRERTEHVPWCYLLAIQAIITVEIGGGDPATVGRDLQLVITGI